jgi:MoxR-like ATPase
MSTAILSPPALKIPSIVDLTTVFKNVGYYAQRDDINAIRWLLYLPPESGVKALLVRGLPGTGKTFMCESIKAAGEDLFGNKREVVYLFMLCNAWDSTEQMFRGIDVSAAVKGDHENVDTPGILTQACLLSLEGKIVIVVFDEIDKTEDRAQNLTLDFLQYARAQWAPGHYVQGDPKNIFFIATSNDMKPLSGALQRRFRDYEMKPLPTKLQVAIISDGLGIDKNLTAGIIVTAHNLAKKARRDLSLQELRSLVQEIYYCSDCPHDITAMLAAWVSRSHRFYNETKAASETLDSEIKAYKANGELPASWKL